VKENFIDIMHLYHRSIFLSGFTGIDETIVSYREDIRMLTADSNEGTVWIS